MVTIKSLNDYNQMKDSIVHDLHDRAFEIVRSNQEDPHFQICLILQDLFVNYANYEMEYPFYFAGQIFRQLGGDRDNIGQMASKLHVEAVRKLIEETPIQIGLEDI